MSQWRAEVGGVDGCDLLETGRSLHRHFRYEVRLNGYVTDMLGLAVASVRRVVEIVAQNRL